MSGDRSSKGQTPPQSPLVAAGAQVLARLGALTRHYGRCSGADQHRLWLLQGVTLEQVLLSLLTLKAHSLQLGSRSWHA